MNRITVINTRFENDYPDLSDVSDMLDSLSEKHPINTVNWAITEYKPEVNFKIAYGNKEIYLKYYVGEEYVKAEKTGINQEVYEDSCVEFFFAPADDGIYYNLEFNAIGAFLIGHGTGRHDRNRIDPAIAGKIRCLPSLGREPFAEKQGYQEWSLTVAIPLRVFVRHALESLRGSWFKANFYKCGDALTEPHYLSWNPVLSEEPDFHRPEYFGEIYFEQ